MINFNNIELVMTAGLPSQFPINNIPQIAFSGRSNVGKSSLINSLLNRKSLARVSASPGKTITINFYEIDKKIYFVDLPGYGYAKRSNEEQRKWSALVDGYITNPSIPVKLIVQLIDLKTGPSRDDITMFDWMNQTDTPYIIVATKSDKLNVTNRNKSLEELKKYGDVIIPFSALKGDGKQEVLNKILEYCEV